MAVSDILKKIESDAEKAAREILEEAKAQADSIKADGLEKARGHRDRLESAARQRADEERNRIVTLAKLSARRDVLAEKQRLIDRVFEETRASIAGMGRDDYQRLIASFLKETIEPGDAEIVVDLDETRIDQAFLDRVAGEMGGCTLRLSEERRAIGGGFIMKSGRTETNCTLDTILRDARERLESRVAETLFGVGGDV
jgi:V/A-type H+-transporting ATPase subunit E